MPELPEVETIRRTLAPRLVGQRVDGVRVLRADIVRSGARGGASLGVGGRVVDVLRYGKQLALTFEDGRAVLFHFGMTGQLFILAPGVRPPRADHLHVRWRLGGESSMWFRDPRRFGGLWAYPSLASLREERWAGLGPDALTISARHLREHAAASRRAIKAALLDQRLLAGVGNIYADEALFLAGIHPEQPAGALSPDRWRRLASAIRGVLRDGIAAGGSTLRDFLDADLRPGSQQLRFRVYGRAGAACTACGGTLEPLVVAQRTTTFCPICQAGGITDTRP